VRSPFVDGGGGVRSSEADSAGRLLGLSQRSWGRWRKDASMQAKSTDNRSLAGVVTVVTGASLGAPAARERRHSLSAVELQVTTCCNRASVGQHTVGDRHLVRRAWQRASVNSYLLAIIDER
jgi:hypothetical protein